MLPPFIIEQIRQREEEKRRDDRPFLELPLDDFLPGDRAGSPRPQAPPADGPPTAERGVVIIEF